MAYQTTKIKKIVALLREWGYTVKYESGWSRRGSSTFNPKGFTDHHDVSPTHLNWGAYNIVVHGRSDLPGPLANFILARDGQIAVIAAGRANHAGRGGWRGLSGNSSVWGCEAANTGTGEKWGARQLQAYRALNLAAEMVTGYGRIMTHGHKEWAPTRKIDPHGINMDTHRSKMGLSDANGGQQGDDEDMARQGDKNAHDLQRILNRYGKKQPINPDWHPLAVDGDYGPATAGAVGHVKKLLGYGKDGSEASAAFQASVAAVAWNDHRHVIHRERAFALQAEVRALKEAVEALVPAEGDTTVLPENALRSGDTVTVLRQ